MTKQASKSNRHEKEEVRPFIEKHRVYDSETIEYFLHQPSIYERHAELLHDLAEKEKEDHFRGLLLAEVSDLLGNTPLVHRAIASLMIQINNHSIVNATIIGMLNKYFEDNKSLKKKVRDTLIPLQAKLQEQTRLAQSNFDQLLKNQEARDELSEKKMTGMGGIG